MKILFVRHAESKGNATNDYSTSDWDSLSELGLRQAERLVPRLLQYPISAVFVSPTRRTIQTITPYLLETGQRGEIWPELAEGCNHFWPAPPDPLQLTPAAAWRPENMGDVSHIPTCFSWRDGKMLRPAAKETFPEGLFRFHEARRLLQALEPTDQMVLLVVHGHFLREILKLYLDMGGYLDFHHENTGLTLIETGRNAKVHFINRQG